MSRDELVKQLAYQHERFDPMQDGSSYEHLTKVCEDVLVLMLGRPLGHLLVERHRSMKQRDAYNCGVLVMYFIECSLGLASEEPITKSMTDGLRFRYLVNLLENARVV